MSLSADLYAHAMRLLAMPQEPVGGAGPVELRRAVSASYYALFHKLGEATVEQLAPHVDPVAAKRIHRWLDHFEMKKICREFAAESLRTPLRELLGENASSEIQSVALRFIKLQEARHSADYDIDYQPSWPEARDFVILAGHSIETWNRLAPSAESNIFVLSMLLWKKWEGARQ